MAPVCSILRSRENKMPYTMTMSPLRSGGQSAVSVFAATGSGDGNALGYKYEDDSVC